MKIKLAVLTAACAFLSLGTAIAADPPERKPASGTTQAAQQTAPNPVSGFGSGNNMGAGGGVGSASSVTGGFGSPLSGSGGSQTFGGGFNQQQTPGAGPLSTGGAGAGAGAGAGRGALGP